MLHVARGVELTEVGCCAVETAPHPATRNHVNTGGAVIGAAALVLPRPAAELGIGHDQRGFPQAQFGESAFQCNEPFCQILEQAGLAQGGVVTARPRPYGTEFAYAAAGAAKQAFYLVLADDWYRELQTRPVQL